MSSLHLQPPLVYGQDQYRLFNRISIETTNYCNRRCEFCPMGHVSYQQRPRSVMDPDLWNKIVAELGELDFHGVVQLFLLNEPLLDPLIIERLAQLRERVPHQCTYLATNGDILLKRGFEYAQTLYASGLTVLGISMYDDEQLVPCHDLLAKITDSRLASWTSSRYLRHNPQRRYIALTDMRPNRIHEYHKTDLLCIRVGKERQHVVTKRALCARAHRHLVVTNDGRVPLCCTLDTTINDPETPWMGNINEQSLLEVWNSEAMWKYRWFTQRADRSLPGCRTCTQRISLAWQVRRVTASPEKLREWQQK